MLATVWSSAAKASFRPVRGQLGEAFESVNWKKAAFVNFPSQCRAMIASQGRNIADIRGLCFCNYGEGVKWPPPLHASIAAIIPQLSPINPLKGPRESAEFQASGSPAQHSVSTWACASRG